MLASSALERDRVGAGLEDAGWNKQAELPSALTPPPINACKTPADLRAWLLSYARSLDLYGGRYVHIGHALWGRERIDAVEQCARELPRERRGRYQPIRFLSTAHRDGAEQEERNWLARDPVVPQVRTAFMPFTWTTQPRGEMTDAQRAWLSTERSRGIGAGIAVPVQDYVAGPAYISFFGIDEAAAMRLVEERAPELAFIGAQFHALARTIMPTIDGLEFISVLTNREIECLRLAALGCTVDESGRQLGISGRTVEFHLKNAGEKLGAPTKLRSVVVALVGGLLHI